ncbi:MAG TPA: N-acetylmuramoyl-L-alanine amidase [Anaerolineae bacterium]|nr:N-acetylmuramoyl-L-alanine amidase [Anaerolineae bacterium]HQI83726.1 N-acetylmuramoyl-L-alanine amidase [Anaerolineae bacterium]
MAGLRQWVKVVVVLGLLVGTTGAVAPPPGLAGPARGLLENAGLPWAVRQIVADGQTLTVCLDVPLDDVRADGGLGAETVQAVVRRALTPLDWRVLRVQAVDPADGACRALSSFLPQATGSTAVSSVPAIAPSAAQFSRALAGKTIYVSAGHGWQWSYTFALWRPQRGVTEGIIEDHNNAEAVGQYLIPYLENAGATVIPVRERDWNAARVIVDNDQGTPGHTETGTWATGGATGYNGGTYRFAATVGGSPTATASWQFAIPRSGTYALYAWVYPGANRAPDAHYTISRAGGTAHVRLDQRIRQQTWRYLGTFPFYAGMATVTLDNASALGSGAVVIADALRLGGGSFDSLSGIVTDAPYPPQRSWWEIGAFYYSQWMGLNYDDWEGFNDVVARPMYARWNHASSGEDALFISWHTNGYDGSVRGTESYVHNSDTYPRTPGSAELQSAVHAELLRDIRAGWDAAWVDRGQRQMDLGELRMLWDDNPATQMPGVLLEIAFHDHPEEARALKDPRFNQLAARAVYQGIVHYFEQRDGVDLLTLPEPPTHLRVQSLGGGAVRVAWQPAPTDGVGLRGEAATGYRVYTSADGFAWSAPIAVAGTSYTLTGLSAGQTLYVRVTATNDGGESFPTEVLGARVGDQPTLLIVNGFDRLDADGVVIEYDPVEGPNARMWLNQMNSRDYVVDHGVSVPAAYAWNSASNEAVADGLVALQDTVLVDWVLGEEATLEDGTLNAAERAAITTFLNSGRALLISGSNLAWDLEGAGRAPAFLRETLRAGYVADDAQTYTVQPVAGGAFAGLGNFSFNAPGEYDADAADVLLPVNGATAALGYVGGTGGVAALQYGAGCQRLLVLGFPLEVAPRAARDGVLARALDFLDACMTPDTTILTPQAGGAYSVTPPFAGSALGWGLTGVTVQVQRASDGAYWTGGGWGAATWLAAAGTTAWSYPLPTLTIEGQYTVTARAAINVQVDPAPALATFTYDVTPPLTPTLITPTGGVFLRTPSLVFQWTAPEDVGSPLAYQLDVGMRVFSAPTTIYTAALPTGVYTWRVRAVDAAGNVGPWSLSDVFEVEVKQVFLPLALRQH